MKKNEKKRREMHIALRERSILKRTRKWMHQRTIAMTTTGHSLQRGDSSAPFGQSRSPSHTLSSAMHTWSVGHSHWPEGQRKGGVGQSCSSLISRQSLSPSHTQDDGTQLLLAHWKEPGWHVRGGQPWCSSEPSSQSECPSHSQVPGMHWPSTWHWNSSSWHRPGPLVAVRSNAGKMNTVSIT